MSSRPSRWSDKLKGRVDPLRGLPSPVGGAGHRSEETWPRVAARGTGSQELDVLQKAFERALTDRRCILTTSSVSLVWGSHASSTSSSESSATERRSCVGDAFPYGDGITFWPLAEVVRQATEIAEGMSWTRPSHGSRPCSRRRMRGGGLAMAWQPPSASPKLPRGCRRPSGRSGGSSRRWRRGAAGRRFRGHPLGRAEFLDLVEYLEGRVETSLLPRVPHSTRTPERTG